MIDASPSAGRSPAERLQRLGRGRQLALRETRPGAELELLVLAAGDGGCVAVDLASGAFVRASWPAAVVDPSVADLTDPEWHDVTAAVDVEDLRDGLEERARVQETSRRTAHRRHPRGSGGRDERERGASGEGGRFRRWGSFLGLELEGADPSPSGAEAGAGAEAAPALRPEGEAPEGLTADREAGAGPRLGAGDDPEERGPTQAPAPGPPPVPAPGPPPGVADGPPQVHLQPLCLVRGRIASDAPLFDPSRPEGVLLEEPPVLFGGAGPLQARRILGSAVAPAGRPLLGFNGPSIAYWQLQGDHGSVAVVEVGRELALRWGTDGGLRARFRWGGTDQDLPVLDATLVDRLAGTRTSPIPPAALRRRLGWEPYFLVVALTGPRGGHCYKVVASALPRP